MRLIANRSIKCTAFGDSWSSVIKKGRVYAYWCEHPMVYFRRMASWAALVSVCRHHGSVNHRTSLVPRVLGNRHYEPDAVRARSCFSYRIDRTVRRRNWYSTVCCKCDLGAARHSTGACPRVARLFNVLHNHRNPACSARFQTSRNIPISCRQTGGFEGTGGSRPINKRTIAIRSLPAITGTTDRSSDNNASVA